MFAHACMLVSETSTLGTTDVGPLAFYFVSCLDQNIYLIISEIVFVVCVSRTIFGKKSKVHVHLEGWKHGNGEVGLNMACTQ